MITEWKDICPTEWKFYHGHVVPKQTTLSFLNFSKEMVYHIHLSDDSLKTRRYFEKHEVLSSYIQKYVSIGYFQDKNIIGGEASPHIYLFINNMRRKPGIIYWMTQNRELTVGFSLYKHSK